LNWCSTDSCSPKTSDDLHLAKAVGVLMPTCATRTIRPIEDIGRGLDADFIMEGSVRQAAGRVRISAQLIRVSDQTHVWAESCERDAFPLSRLSPRRGSCSFYPSSSVSIVALKDK
jgi:hypothetical protein